MELLALLKGAGLALPAILQPGPLQAFLLARAARLGVRRALPAALAPLLSDGPILVLVLLVLTQVPAWGLRVVQVAGGAFLLRLAWGALADARHPATVSVDPAAAGRSLRDAVVVNLLNPNPYLFWSLVAGPLLIDALDHSVTTGIAFLVGFYGVFVAGLALTVVLFGRLGGLGPGARRVAGFASALALAGFGLWQLARGALG